MATEQDISSHQLPGFFHYDSLPDGGREIHIRLIELLPGRSPDPIRCNLQATPLARSVKYECLSYCWGDTKNVVIILCNGVSLPVTANLMGALQALRQEDKPRRVWVDAICINQGSIPERNQQVAVMRDIYRNATRTVVWLGYEADDSNAALAIVPDLLTVRNTFGHRGDSSTPVEVPSRFTLSPKRLESIPKLNPLIQNKQARQAFLTLLQRPWFSRVWIVQEVTVSVHATFVCGSQHVSFEDLAQAAWTFDYLDLHIDIGSRRPMDRFWDIWDTRRKHRDWWPNTMFQLLLRHRWCQATDPRDKVYALCSIANDAAARPQRYAELLGPGWYRTIELPSLSVVVDQPNYGVATVDVFTRLASILLKLPQVSLDLFSAIHPSEPRLSGLPSWAPDWSATGWFSNFRKSSKNTFYEQDKQGPFWSPMLEDPPPGPGVPPKEKCIVIKGGWVGSRRDVPLTKSTVMCTEYVRSFQACGESRPDIRFLDPPKTITLSGMVVDIIEELGEPGVKTGSEPIKLLERSSEWATIAQRAHGHALDRIGSAMTTQPLQSPESETCVAASSTATYLHSPDPEAAIHAWVSTIMGGHIFVDSDADALAGYNAFLRDLKLKQQFNSHCRVLDIVELRDSGQLAAMNPPREIADEAASYDAEETRRKLAEVEAELAELRTSGDWPLADKVSGPLGMGINRRFAVGKKGYYALLPGLGRKGDEIVVFKGGCMPVLVRDRREIVGECYVYGIMQGEVWREELCEEFVIF